LERYCGAFERKVGKNQNTGVPTPGARMNYFLMTLAEANTGKNGEEGIATNI